MARIESLNLLTTDSGKSYLAELYGKTIEGVMKALVSTSMKNDDLSGDPVSGTVEAKRFANAAPKKYGTARAAGKGDAVKAATVTVALDEDDEIIEELEEKDVRLYGVEGVLERRARNHVLSMSSALDTKFFKVAGENAVEVEVDLAGGAIEDILEAVIQECENTQNDFVDGVPRELMSLTLNTTWYGKVRNNLDKQTRSNVDTAAEEFYTWHGVECKSSVHMPTGVPFILMVKGAVAQPIMPKQYTAEKIPLSNAYGVELFYSHGTKAVTPDLIFKPKQST